MNRKLRARPEQAEVSASDSVGEADLFIEVDDDQYRFPPGRDVTVGTHPDCDVPVQDPLVSLRHLRFRSQGDRWVVEDLNSERGTFIDGRRLRRKRTAKGAFFAILGDDDAGERLRVVAPGHHRVPRPRLAMAGLAVATLAVVGTVAALVFLAGSGPANTAEQLAAAKASTVFLGLIDDEEFVGHGSGSYLGDGYILTNRHVAEGVDYLVVGISPAADENAVARYTALHAASHPYLDIALVRISGDLEDNAAQDADLPVIPLGGSDGLTVGQPVHALGFPSVVVVGGGFFERGSGEYVLPSVSVSGGEIANIQAWPGCDRPNYAQNASDGTKCAPHGDVPRSRFVTTHAGGRGESGGPVIRDGELVAVSYAANAAEVNQGVVADSTVAMSIAIDGFRDWLTDNMDNR